jgi:hypothetical protein
VSADPKRERRRSTGPVVESDSSATLSTAMPSIPSLELEKTKHKFKDSSSASRTSPHHRTSTDTAADGGTSSPRSTTPRTTPRSTPPPQHQYTTLASASASARCASPVSNEIYIAEIKNLAQRVEGLDATVKQLTKLVIFQQQKIEEQQVLIDRHERALNAGGATVARSPSASSSATVTAAASSPPASSSTSSSSAAATATRAASHAPPQLKPQVKPSLFDQFFGIGSSSKQQHKHQLSPSPTKPQSVDAAKRPVSPTPPGAIDPKRAMQSFSRGRIASEPTPSASSNTAVAQARPIPTLRPRLARGEAIPDIREALERFKATAAATSTVSSGSTSSSAGSSITFTESTKSSQQQQQQQQQQQSPQIARLLPNTLGHNQEEASIAQARLAKRPMSAFTPTSGSAIIPNSQARRASNSIDQRWSIANHLPQIMPALNQSSSSSPTSVSSATTSGSTKKDSVRKTLARWQRSITKSGKSDSVAPSAGDNIPSQALLSFFLSSLCVSPQQEQSSKQAAKPLAGNSEQHQSDKASGSIVSSSSTSDVAAISLSSSSVRMASTMIENEETVESCIRTWFMRPNQGAFVNRLVHNLDGSPSSFLTRPRTESIDLISRYDPAGSSLGLSSVYDSLRWWHRIEFSGTAHMLGTFHLDYTEALTSYITNLCQNGEPSPSDTFMFIRAISQKPDARAMRDPKALSAFEGRVRSVACGPNSVALVSDLGEIHLQTATALEHCCLGSKTPVNNWMGMMSVSKLLGRRVITLATGAHHFAAVTDVGELILWGANFHAEILGDTSSILRGGAVSTPPESAVIDANAPTLPRKRTPSSGSTEILTKRPLTPRSAGNAATPAILVSSNAQPLDETIVAGQCCDGEKSYKTPTIISGFSGKLLDVACGWAHTVVITERGVYSCGSDKFGQLGRVGGGTNLLRIRLPMQAKIYQVACGAYHTIAITEQGNAYSWGCNNFGQVCEYSLAN